MSKIVLHGYILVAAADLAAVTRALPEHIKLSRSESGCVVFDVARDQNRKHRFNVYEEFVDRAAFELHQQRVKNSVWGKISANVERHYCINDTH